MELNQLRMDLITRELVRIAEGPKRPKREKVVDAIWKCMRIGEGDVVICNGKFHYIQRGKVLTSDDGMTWTIPRQGRARRAAGATKT